MHQPKLDITAALVRGAGLISDICATAAAEHDLTVQQAQLLCVLAHGPVTMAQLGALLRITKSSTTGLVDRAEEANLVARNTQAHDRRSHTVHLTQAGDRIGTAYRALVTERIAALFQDVPGVELEVLRSALSRVVLTNQARENWPAAAESVA